LLTGGLSGIAIILHFITDYPIWLWYIALNIPVFIAGYKLASRRFTVYSFVGMMSVSGFLALLSPLNIQLPVNDILLSALLGGTLNGVGVGLALIYRGSTGGLDIIAGIFHRLWGINFGTTIFITNVLVLGAALLTSNLYLTLYSALTMFVSSKMIDSVTSGFISKKTVLIVSKKSDDIANAILHRMHRGCTLLSGKGAYTGQAENIIMVTTGKTQVPHLKELIFSLDPQAFITITDTVEVYGRGFKPWDTEDV
jgi:uncharacterized membrane-anchored protein YitT (DUF2179 family)